MPRGSAPLAHRAGLPLLLCGTLVGCGGGGSALEPEGSDPPSELSYPTAALRVPSGSFMPQLVPTVEGGAPTAYSIEPGLPTGLALSPTGVLAGAAEQSLAETTFTITASNDGGSTSTELVLRIDETFDTPRFLYVSNYEDHTLSSFVATPEGDLRHHGYTAADPHPGALATSPSGHHLYTIHPTVGRISVFRADPATGDLERVDHVETLPGTVDLAVDTTGEWLYAAHATGIATFRAGGTDTLEIVADAEVTGPVAVTLHPAGHTLYAALFGTGRIGVYALDSGSGAVSEIETEVAGAAGSEPAALAMHPNGAVLYAAHSGAGEVGVYAVDPERGYLELASVVPAGTRPVDLELTADGTTLFVTDLDGAQLLTFAIDDFDGSLTSAGDGPMLDAPYSLVSDTAGSGVYVTHPVTSDIGHWSGEGGVPSEVNRVRTRGGASDAVMLFGPSELSYEVTFAFTANQQLGDLSTLALDGSTGTLTDLGQPISAGGDPLSLGFDANGSHLYAATVDGALAPFHFDADELSDDVAPVLAGGDLRALTLDPTGRFVFAVGEAGIASFAIGSDGGLTANEELAAGDEPSAVVVEPGGLYTYVLNEGSADVSGYWIHGVTGRLEELDGSPWALPAGTDPTALAVHPGGRFLWVADRANGILRGMTIAVDGSLAPLAADKVVQAPSYLAPSPDGLWLVAASFTRSEITLCEIDRLTGTLATAAVHSGVDGPAAVHVDANGDFAYVADSVADQVSVFALDSGAGQLNKVQDVELGSGAGPTAVVTSWQLVEVD